MQRLWNGRRAIGLVGLVGSLLLLALLISGCGGGGVSEPPKPLWQTTRVVGPEGATIETPEQYGAKIEIAANTFSSPTQVRVEVYPAEIESNRLPQGVVPSSHVVRVHFDSNPADQQGSILVILPTHATRQSSDGWDIMTTYLSTGIIAIKGMRHSDSSSMMCQINSDKLLELLRQNSYLQFQVTHYNSTPPVVPPFGWFRWNENKWEGGTPEWGGKRIAILIHGIRNDIKNLNDLAKKLKSYYDEIWGFNYDWRNHISANGAELAKEIRTHATNTTRIDIYGHSMGGLVARYALEKGNVSAYVERLYTMGTPHLGVPINDPTDMPGDGWWVVLDDIIAWLADLTTDGVLDLLEKSEFLSNLNDNSREAQNTVYIVFGGKKYSDYLSVSSFSFGNYAHAQIYNYADCDGIVAVYSALPFLSDSPNNSLSEAVRARRRWSDITRTKGAIWVRGSQEPSLNQNHSEIKLPPNLDSVVKDNADVKIR